VLIPVARIIHATNSPIGLPPVPEIAAQSRKFLPQNLRFLDQRLADGRPFVAGDHPTVVDCTLQAALQFARFGKVEIDSSFEHLARWDRDYQERPTAKSVLTA
jgi:glutathione S-transferase